MEFYLGFLVFYVHLVHIFPPNFSVRRHGIQEVSGSNMLASMNNKKTDWINFLRCTYNNERYGYIVDSAKVKFANSP